MTRAGDILVLLYDHMLSQAPVRIVDHFNFKQKEELMARHPDGSGTL